MSWFSCSKQITLKIKAACFVRVQSDLFFCRDDWVASVENMARQLGGGAVLRLNNVLIMRIAQLRNLFLSLSHTAD
jgi:hypothetical protein